MNKMKMETPNLTLRNIEKIEKLFPSCITESKDANGQLKKTVNFEMLRQLLSEDVLEGNEAYEFTWVGKKAAIVEANKSIRKTLRPCPEESVDWNTTKNLYIEGDNLEVLKLLQESYLGKIKMIYIDPPYNTGNDFIYRDKFAVSSEEYGIGSGAIEEDTGNRLFKNTDTNGRFHSDWCSMIYARLLLARNLLSDDGIIFISIDDNEQENLKIICSEVFGHANFIGMLSVENNPKGRKNSDFISVSSEYCLIFAKSKSLTYFIENIPKKASDMVQDENGKFVHNSGKRVIVGENSFNKPVTVSSSAKNYSVYYREYDNSLILKTEKYDELDEDLISKGYNKYYSHHDGKLIENTYTRERFTELFESGALAFSGEKIYEKNYSDTVRIKSQLVNKEYEAIVNGEKKGFSMELTTTGAGTYLKELFKSDEVLFSAPKNTGFLKILISLLDSKDFITLDFFSGSSSTADAIMQLNATDSGSRRFIMVQLPEPCDKKSEAYKAGYKNICEIGKERIRRAGQKIKRENPLLTSDLDIGFRVLKLDETNMNEVEHAPGEYTRDLFKQDEDNIKEDRTDLDLLFGCLLDWGVTLSEPYESIQIEGYTVHNYNDGDLVACFDKNIPESVIKEIAKLKPERAVFRDSCFKSSAAKINVEQIFKMWAPDSEVRVI